MFAQSDYYRAILLATRDSARAIQAIARLSRQVRDAERDGRACAAEYRALARARARYARAQQTLAQRPLCAADIAARQADYPRARES